MSKKKVSSKSLAENRKARYNYEIGETLECGLVLVGSEVKSLRDSGGLIAESYASIEEGELWLINCYIPLHSNSKTFGHEERRGALTSFSHLPSRLRAYLVGAGLGSAKAAR